MITSLLFLVAVLGGYHAPVEANQSRSGIVNRYFVYTRTNFFEPKEILLNDPASFDESDILISRDTFVIVHGHSGSAFNSLNPSLKNAILQSLDLNVIVVDWSSYSRLSYSLAVAAVPSIGTYLGDLITALVNDQRVALNRLHLVGFNLGAHVVGYTGRRLNGQVARITGLDPSGKQFGDTNSGRLTISDALYVEVIHTDGDGLLANGLGTAIGHVDFFPNGGSNQPGCFLSHTCSHNRAWEFFVATFIEGNELVGRNCATNLQLVFNRCNGDPLIMGTNQYGKRGSGTYRVNTGSSSPF